MISEMQQNAYQRKESPRWTTLQMSIADWYEKERPEAWREAFVPLIQGTMQETGREWATTLGVTWNVRNLAAEDWFQSYTLKFAQPITEVSAGTVQDVIAQGMAEGWSIPETNKKLGQVFEQWISGDVSPEDLAWFTARNPTYRREMISRTETIRAANAGTFNMMRDWGAETKGWLAASDSRTRDDHKVAGQTYSEGGTPGFIPVNEPFMVGGYRMQHPGDASNGAPPSQYIQCRCSILVGPIVNETKPVQGLTNFRNITETNLAEFEQEWQSWYDSLAGKEKIAIRSYTENTYERMNTYLRYGGYIDPSVLRRVETLQELLNRTQLQEGLMVHRGAGLNFLNIDRDNLPNLIGTVINDKGFTSTSVLQSEAFGIEDQTESYLIDMRLRPGTHGAYVAQGSADPESREFVLAPDSNWTVIDAFYDETTNKRHLIVEVGP